MTKVVNIRNEPYDVYIGRARWVAGSRQSGYFGNPFRIGVDGDRNEVIKKYTAWFHKLVNNDPSFRKRVLDLRGKTLGCFCKPEKCHGDVIVKWLENNAD